jgi:pimeloyl-ACP methyl ester carboxylesterase
MDSAASPDHLTWIDLPGHVRLRVMVWGTGGPTILLVHAASLCAGAWTPVAEALRGSCRVVAYDLRGHGDSDAPAGPDEYRWDAFADDFAAVVHWAQVEFDRGVDLCATHSFSGDCALMACAGARLPLNQLVLLDPVLADEEGARLGGEALAEGTLRLSEKEREGFASAEVAADWIERCLRKQLAREGFDPRCKEALAAWAMRRGGDGRYQFKCTREVEAAIYRNRVAVAARLATMPLVTARTHIVFARKRRTRPEDQDQVFARDSRQAEAVRGRCTKSTLEVMEEVGHFLVLEAPHEIARLLTQWR